MSLIDSSPLSLRTMTLALVLASGVRAAAALPPGACPDEALVAEATGLRLSAEASAPALAFARAGAEVRLLACEGDWAEVETAESGHGWVPLALLESREQPPPERRSSTPAAFAPALRAPSVSAGSVEPLRPLLLREEPRWSSAVAGRSPAGTPVEVLSGSERGWSLVDAGLDRPAWVVTAALDAPPLIARR